MQLFGNIQRIYCTLARIDAYVCNSLETYKEEESRQNGELFAQTNAGVIHLHGLTLLRTGIQRSDGESSTVPGPQLAPSTAAIPHTTINRSSHTLEVTIISPLFFFFFIFKDRQNVANF